ncbi:MAG: DNA alkylation repair protein [Firmicutes bacterium]|nr:DNA alkylation repair protein [Bacillota bacterium]MCM1401656.1 DNA alkylation repair protein [Bacteroides sp.]MCM1477567.1 DNA alkylation repair protein [Bacteroides sp.]
MTNADDIEVVLLSMADEHQARLQLRFFKTGRGEYGEGDKFIGLKNPQVRMVVKEAWKDTPLQEATKLVKSPLHEVRLCGLLILVEQYLKALKENDKTLMNTIFNTYTSLHRHINNWDLVDLSAIKIVGNHEVQDPAMDLMNEWIEPAGHTLWQQRIAMVSTWMLIRRGRVDQCFRRATTLLDSPHDLLHKAAGWMLREAWKKGYKNELRDFLEENVTRMPSVMLSYACEQMQINERHEWQHRRKPTLKNKIIN